MHKSGNNIVNTIEIVQGILTKLSNEDRMKPIDFGDQRPKVKVTIDKRLSNLVNTIEVKLLSVF